MIILNINNEIKNSGGNETNLHQLKLAPTYDF